MSLDVMLYDDAGHEIHSRNLTHNLAPMADAAGLHDCLRQPERAGITHARQVVGPLAAGLAQLEAHGDKFRPLNALNGWGKLEHLQAFCAGYLAACRENPDALVHVSR